MYVVTTDSESWSSKYLSEHYKLYTYYYNLKNKVFYIYVYVQTVCI